MCAGSHKSHRDLYYATPFYLILLAHFIYTSRVFNPTGRWSSHHLLMVSPQYCHFGDQHEISRECFLKSFIEYVLILGTDNQVQAEELQESPEGVQYPLPLTLPGEMRGGSCSFRLLCELSAMCE